MKTVILSLILLGCLVSQGLQAQNLISVDVDTLSIGENPTKKVAIDTTQAIHLELKNFDGHQLKWKGQDGAMAPLTPMAGSTSKFDISETGESLFQNFEVTDAQGQVKKFVLAYDVEKKKDPDTETKPKPKHPTLMPVPIPTGANGDRLEDSLERNSHLIIDIDPVTGDRINSYMYRVQDLNNPVKYVYINSSLSVFLRKYSFGDIEKLSLSINDKDYSYEKGLKDVYDEIGNKSGDEDEEPKDEDKLKAKSGSDDSTLQDYLEMVWSRLKDVKYLNLNDAYRTQAFQKELKTSIQAWYKTLTSDENELLSKITSWRAEYVAITKIPVKIGDTDEVEVELKITHEGESEETYDVGSYPVKGGMGFSLNSTLFITGLVNKEVFTQEVANGNNTELRAMLGDGNDNFTMGIGTNAEISFRTGQFFRPTVNVGFFIPFDEDISPNAALGLGFTISTSKVKFSISGGMALGSVNAIRDRYKNTDLSTMTDLTNEMISHKVWKTSWQVGFGLGFNLAKDK